MGAARAVELVGLDHHIVARCRQQIVGAIVFRDSSQEGVALYVTLMKDVGTHARRCRLAMRSCHTKSFMLLGENAQHLCTLQHLKTLLAKPHQLLMLGWHGGRVDNQAGLRVLAGVRDVGDTLLVVNQHALFLQLPCEVGGSLIVACHHHATMHEVAGDSTHSDASGTNEIDSFYMIDIHLLFLSFCRFFTCYRCTPAIGGRVSPPRRQ